jgi:2-dehydro-3-deoxyphosphogluconate aldolase/(4S)-4-hydroxy-2-oxoglutarate aldolase
MRSRNEIISLLKSPGIIAVIRAQSSEQALLVCEALVEGGVIALEITMTTPNAFAAIADAKKRFRERAVIGVGTVITEETARAAIAAGAEFVVSPITRASIVKAAHASDRPVMIGAYTATEAQTAYEAGADFIKLFPADGLGPGYVKALRAPLPHLQIVPTGGVVLKNAGEWLRAGCAAVGVGSSLIRREFLEHSNWSELSKLSADFVTEAEKARS